MFFMRKITYIVNLFGIILLRYCKLYHSRKLNTSLNIFMIGTIPVTLVRKGDHSPLYVFMEDSISLLVDHHAFCFNEW